MISYGLKISWSNIYFKSILIYRGQRLELIDSNSPRHLVVHFIVAVYCENTAAQTASFDLSTILSNTHKTIGSWIRASNYFQGLNFLMPKIPIRKWFNLTGNEYLKFVLGFDTEIYISPAVLVHRLNGLVSVSKFHLIVTFCRVEILNKNWSCSVAWDCKICLFWYNGPMVEFNYFLWFLFHPYNELSPPRYQWQGSVRLSIPNHGLRLQVPRVL